MSTSQQDQPDPSLKPLSHHEVHVWALQMHIMLSSGVPLVTALDSIASSDLPRLAPTCEALSQRLSSGYRLSDGMRSLKPAFSDFVVNMAVVGESTGNLAAVLERASQRASRRDKMEREIKGALAYPFFLAVVSISMAVFMGFYMFPKLLPFLTGLGVALPWPTRVLVWCSESLPSFVLIGTILLVFFVNLVVNGKDARIARFREWILFHSPVIGDINRDRAYSDCLADLCLLLEAGCDLMTSLKTLNTSSAGFQSRIANCIDEIRGGADFTESVERSQMLPTRFLLQLKSGEETGKLAKVFRQISHMLDESVGLRISQFVQLMEPAILIVMGGITGFIVLATFLPLYSMASTAL